MCSTVILLLLISSVLCDYWSQREKLLNDEDSLVMGSSIILSNNEIIVNNFLMKQKWEEFDNGFRNPGSFIPARHLFDTLSYIEQSDVFHFIQKVPKGALLHGHDTALASGDYLYNLTFSDNLYACVSNEKIQLRFLKEAVIGLDCVWKPIHLLRETVTDFDIRLKQQLTLIRENHREVYTDINVVWNYFSNIFLTVDPLICYKPIFIDYFYQVLTELYEDNVFYIEFRTTLPTVYDLDGNMYGPIEVAGLYKQIVEDFMLTHPEFLGAKLIYAPIRNVDEDTMQGYVDTVRALKANFPDFLAGFDLVGQEDLGQPLVKFVTQLQEIKKEVNLFFHAGETNWFGSSTDENLIDAVLLGTLRIGHGYAALKRPEILKIIKTYHIAVEICPISNQVLLLSDDMRNHPANYLIANDFPVIISNDDPSFWGTKGLSYDWYMAFMGMTSRRTDLRFLKQLAINSIKYSVYHDKNLAMKMWQQKWDNFINTLAKKIMVDEVTDNISLIKM
ncbi:adenosine deaminase [Holotrichia oblita]|uniref:Adenosine deaminase n=2 Tax=Holotrichia oblita TaxID=644536 RepID=A0ACB9SI06_HOLOL|nr:adenosine deaminase [Holotrichia oblita]KAI4459388.1 adenosine deaminase [Holotrichia oblita]